MSAPDENDLLRAGQLPHDPAEGCGPPLTINPVDLAGAAVNGNATAEVPPPSWDGQGPNPYEDDPQVDGPPRDFGHTDAHGAWQPGPRLEPIPAEEKPRPIVRLADRVRALATLGEPRRVPTGLEWIDTITRGGLMVGKLMTVIGGAPNAGKTSLMVQIGHNAARAGVPVAIHAADEAAEGIIIRIGQALGFAQEDLERRDPDALEALAQRLDGLPLLVMDQDLDEVAVEDTADILEALRAELGAPVALLCVDSIQKARGGGGDKAKDQRGRAECVVGALKRIGARSPFAIVATSELSRGAYRNPKDKIAALAAFKDSGDIEYAARLALVLNTVPGEAGKLVDVDVPKNKAGKIEGDEAGFRMRIDRARCTYEVEPRPPPGDGEEDTDAKLDAAARKLVSKVVAYVARVGSKGATGDQIEAHVTGKGTSLRRAAKLAAGDGDLVVVEGRYYAPSSAPGEDCARE